MAGLGVCGLVTTNLFYNWKAKTRNEWSWIWTQHVWIEWVVWIAESFTLTSLSSKLRLPSALSSIKGVLGYEPGMVGLNIWTGPLSHAYLPQQALVKSHQGIIGPDGVLAWSSEPRSGFVPAHQRQRNGECHLGRASEISERRTVQSCPRSFRDVLRCPCKIGTQQGLRLACLLDRLLADRSGRVCQILIDWK